MVSNVCRLCKNTYETTSRSFYCPNCREEANRLRVKKWRETHPTKLSYKTTEQIKNTCVYKNIKLAFEEEKQIFLLKKGLAERHFEDIETRSSMLEYYDKMIDQGMTYSELYRKSGVSKSVFNDYHKVLMRKNLLVKKNDHFYLGEASGLDSMMVIHEDIFHMSTPENLFQTMTCGYYFPGFNVDDFSYEEKEIIKDSEHLFYKAQFAFEDALYRIKQRRLQIAWQEFIDDASIFVLTRFFKWAEFVFLKSVHYFIIKNIIKGKKMPETDLNKLLPQLKVVCIDACLTYIFFHKYPNLSELMKKKIEEEIHKCDTKNSQRIEEVFSKMQMVESSFSNHMVITNNVNSIVNLINASKDKEKELQEYCNKMSEWDSFEDIYASANENRKNIRHKLYKTNFFKEYDFFSDDLDLFDMFHIPINDLYSRMDNLASLYSRPKLPDKLRLKK